MTPRRRARILEITSYPPPRAGWGVRVSFVRAHLEALGHECHVLNIGKSRRIKSSDYLDVQSSSHYVRQVLAHVRNGYTVHTHLNGDSPKGLMLALIAEALCFLLGRPCVLTFHAGPIQLLFPKSRSRAWAPWYALAFALPRVIVCNNEAVKARILEYGVPPEKVVPIPAFSGQYLEYRTVPLPDELESFLLRHRPVISSYFFLRPEFFVESLMDALGRIAAQLPDAGFVLLGGETRTEQMTAMIAAAGIADRVHAAGDLDHDAFLSLVARCHISIRTPAKDGVSSSVLEALSLGIPVVASENGTRPASVITFPRGDGAALAETVERVWRDYDACRSRVVRPPIRDTVVDEARLLLSLALPGADPTQRVVEERRP
jgi:glycosyltransferase involved in cell wall biosynthesis